MTILLQRFAKWFVCNVCTYTTFRGWNVYCVVIVAKRGHPIIDYAGDQWRANAHALHIPERILWCTALTTPPLYNI